MYAGLFAVAAAVLACFAPSRILPLDDGRPDRPRPASIDAVKEKPPLIHPVAVLPGLVLACTVAGFATFGAFIPEYSREVGMAASGGLFAVYALSSLLVRIFGARMPEQLGPRRAVTIGISNIMISLLILTLFPTVAGALDRGDLHGSRRGVQLSVADGAHREPGLRSRSRHGRQLVHDVLRGRQRRRRI